MDRAFSSYFDGQVHQVGPGLVISIRDVSPIEYLFYRTKYDPKASTILERFKDVVDSYLPKEVNTSLPSRAHIYRFFNHNETILIFHIINFVYDFKHDKVVRAYNVSFDFLLPSQLQGKKLSVWVYSEELPHGVEVPYELKGDTVSITIPEVSILTSIEIRPRFEVPEPLVIEEPTVLNNGTYELNRSVIVRSSLSIMNSHIKMEGGAKPIGIEILQGGSLKIVNSTIERKSGFYYILAREGSSIFINRSEISGAGFFGPLEKGGICIETEGAVILDSKIHDNYDYGLLLFKANNSIIVNNEFYGNALAVSISDSSFVKFHNNTVKENYAGVLIRSSHVEMGIAELCRMYYDLGILPPRGPVKQVISNCRIFNNHLANVILSGTNFATIASSECGGASVINVLIYRSIANMHDCSIHSSWMGVMLYESPIVTMVGNRIYNHTRVGIKVYKCCSMGILHWLHLEPIAAYSDEGDIRIIGNYIEDNEYGVYLDFEGGPHGYFNRHVKISDNSISRNSIGMYVSRTVGEVIRNNFIENKIHVESGVEPLPAFSIDHPKTVGNHWDTYYGTGPYEVLPGRYDNHPLTTPVEIPKIEDNKGPLVRIEKSRIKRFNETHVLITLDFHVSDEQSYLGDVDFLAYLGFITLLSPNMREREFGWIGFAMAILGPEQLSTSYNVYNLTFLMGWTAEMEPVPFPKEWVKNATLTAYATDIWGNWNKNDSSPPYIKILEEQRTVIEGASTTIYAVISDWSVLSKVQLLYSAGSEWKAVDMALDEPSLLFIGRIPPQSGGTTVYYKIYAEDVYGNAAETKQNSFVVMALAPTKIPGDVNGDNLVNYLDLAILASSYGKSKGEVGFNPTCDLNEDGIVNYLDLAILAANYGKTV